MVRLVIVMAVCALGCGRINFDPLGTGGGNDASDASDTDAIDATFIVAGDTCAQANDVDLSSGSATFLLSTQGANDDYGDTRCCIGLADVVIRVRNPTLNVTLECAAGTGQVLWIETTDGCPQPISGLGCGAVSCDGSNGGQIGSLADGSLIVLCRDSALPAATVTITNQ